MLFWGAHEAGAGAIAGIGEHAERQFRHEVGRASMDAVPHLVSTTGRSWQDRAKRALDIVTAAVLLVLVLSILIVSAVAIRLESRGPVIFRQTRVGAHGRRFTILKLRTMQHDNDDSEHYAYVASLMSGNATRNGSIYKLVDDRRITRVGRVLRRLSIDELPQLLNVLAGDMSIVGPRPSLPSETELYDERTRKRLAHKPGLTGLWQVSGRSELTFRQMVDLDLWYIENWNLWSDIKILAKTPWQVVKGRGAA